MKASWPHEVYEATAGTGVEKARKFTRTEMGVADEGYEITRALVFSWPITLVQESGWERELWP